jgi:hypothetical protein
MPRSALAPMQFAQKQAYRQSNASRAAAGKNANQTDVYTAKHIAPAPLPCLPVTGGGTLGPLHSITTLPLYRWASPLPCSPSLLSDGQRLLDAGAAARFAGIIGVVVPLTSGGRRGGRSHGACHAM